MTGICAEAITEQLAASLAASRRGEAPFPHWLLDAPFTGEVARELAGLPFVAPAIDDTQGRRETHNSSRQFFDRDRQQSDAICRAVAEALQSSATVGALARATGADLDGASLRIEYCLDTEGFWLEPHTDIGAKRFTMLVYLSDGPGAEDWGTDLYRPDGSHFARVPGRFDTGLVFVPSSSSWHGFERRPMAGVRRSIIVNYVGPEWRARHELAFPDRPVRAA